MSVLFGGNDMFQAVDTPAGPGRATLQGISVQKVLENAADRVADGIREIAGLLGGGVFDEFLLLTLPGGGLAEFYNNQLAANVTDLRSEGLKIINLDTDEVFGEIIGDALFNGGGVFGITDVTGACTASLNDPTGASCLDIRVDPNTIALVDSVHPNAVVHQVLGDRAISVVISAVPLPAGMPLMLVGLGAFAAMRKRRS